MTNPRRTKDAQSAATRAELIRIARELWSERGYDHASAEEVAARAGVTTGALYHQFKDKRALFAAVFEDVEDEITRRLTARGLAEGDPLTQFVEALKGFVRIAVEPEIRRIVLVDSRTVLGWDEWRRVMEVHGLGQLRAWLTRITAAGALPEQPIEPLAHMLLGALTGAAMLVAYSDEAGEMERTCESLERLVRGLGSNR
jgi:AcrR family transcriptional regulator